MGNEMVKHEGSVTVAQLIAELQKVKDKSKLVYVWEGYNAGCMTSHFDVTETEENTVDLAPM